jgi:glycerol-3-phosphate cytidylyltransferase
MARVYTGGTFDLIHPGHITLLRHCFDLSGDDGEVVVALNTDDFVEHYKGHRPVMSYNDRRDVLLALRWVDRIVPNSSGADSKPTILKVDPDIIAIGEDWHPRNGKDYMRQMQFTEQWLRDQEISLVYVPLLFTHRGAASYELHSSTRLRLRAQAAAQA